MADIPRRTITAALAAAIPAVHAAEDNTIRVALIGCGGRGGGAALDACATTSGPIKLVAMADAFADRLQGCANALKPQLGAKFDVPPERQFVGWDAYKKAMDCLRPGDVALFATPPAFRWVHFGYAIEKGLNVFMEKPVSVDGPSTQRMLKLAAEAEKKNLKVGVGLMYRHCKARQELWRRLKEGQIGDIVLLRSYRMHGPVGSFASGPKPAGMSDLDYQVRRFHSFIWASGGCFNDFYIHDIDECCWMKGAWPVQAQALGAREYRGANVDQNFDNYAVEYTFADGTKLFFDGRTIDGCYGEFATYAHGSKGSAVISIGVSPAQCRIFKAQKMQEDQIAWAYPGNEPNPYRLEWEDLVNAIRRNEPYNEAKRGAEASLVSSMGRMAAHTAQVITYDKMLTCPHDMAPDLDKLTADSPAPLQPGPDGKYPVPQPGRIGEREY